jgi:hypothetical protein
MILNFSHRRVAAISFIGFDFLDHNEPIGFHKKEKLHPDLKA